MKTDVRQTPHIFKMNLIPDVIPVLLVKLNRIITLTFPFDGVIVFLEVAFPSPSIEQYGRINNFFRMRRLNIHAELKSLDFGFRRVKMEGVSNSVNGFPYVS